VYGRGTQDFEPLDVAGRSTVKPLAPFENGTFDARRVFLLVATNGGSGGETS
jgi:hypothetical protein